MKNTESCKDDWRLMFLDWDNSSDGFSEVFHGVSRRNASFISSSAVFVLVVFFFVGFFHRKATIEICGDLPGLLSVCFQAFVYLNEPSSVFVF